MAAKNFIVLGLESSCDETAAALVRSNGEILSNQVRSQIEAHRPYGGVVPEIAARAHIEHLDGLIVGALSEAGIGLDAVDVIAATAGPGLIGGLLVAVMTGKAIAAAGAKPFLAINHLEAHALSARLLGDAPFPYLLLLISGGHCQLLIVWGVGDYQRLGTTLDDAVGEAYDKTAKLLGLGYPGGPALEAAARTGDPARYRLPRPLIGRPGCHFSFSGLKTAVYRTVEKHQGALSNQDRADIAAAFQAAVIDVLIDRSEHAFDSFEAELVARNLATEVTERRMVVAGGVAANQALRAAFSDFCETRGCRLIIPPPAFCTDNGAMVAWAGVERYRNNLQDSLTAPARARWPLDPQAAPVIGAGVKA